uniref:Gamma-soluble NSF attachment protein n=1 Tax=Phallusia mammillata TaxID=59560 RepID=A0A6F9DMD5_9ASCI|nr:gamma-soluble NSF attachment protein-like [Phallusia mammillata]
MSTKIQEADKLVEEAEKHLKTGFFKWRPDYDSAASCFQKAGILYKNAKCHEKASATFLKLADSHYRNQSRFHAGKAYEEAAQVYKDMKDFSKALAHFDHASELYLEDGTPDTAAMCLDRAGKIVEMNHPDWAISSYMKAAQIYENEDESRFRSAAELVGKVARLQVKLNKLSEAVKSITHEKQLLSQVQGGDHGAGSRLTCALVLVHLHIGDQVRAEQSIFDACDSIVGFGESEEYHALQNLIEAFDERNEEKAAQLLNMPLFKYMDTAYAKLARSLHVQGYTESSSQQKHIFSKGVNKQNMAQLSEQFDNMADKMAYLQASVPTVTDSELQSSNTNIPPNAMPPTHESRDVAEEIDLC